MSKTDRQYYHNPKAAFQEGFYTKKGTKTIGATCYWKYHYFLPCHIKPVINSLQEYFKAIDCYANIPRRSRRRENSMEFADLAADTLYQIRTALATRGTIAAGSPSLHALPWAIFGASERFAKNKFATIYDIFEHYDGMIWATKGFNVLKVLHRQNKHNKSNKLEFLSETYDRSVNYIFAVAVLLLYDLVCHCGPDGGEFMSLFGNDMRESKEEMIARWRKVRAELFPSSPKVLADVLGPHQTFPTFGNYSNTGKKKGCTISYSHVEIIDCGISSSLILGEKVTLHEKDFKDNNNAATIEVPSWEALIRDKDKLPIDDEAALLADDAPIGHYHWLNFIGQEGYDY